MSTPSMSTQGKLGKDAGSVACLLARERLRTPIQRSHACSSTAMEGAPREAP
jgi:hypothetical protein